MLLSARVMVFVLILSASSYFPEKCRTMTLYGFTLDTPECSSALMFDVSHISLSCKMNVDLICMVLTGH